MGLRIATTAGGPASAPQRLSLCMIVRDEEEHLPRCLESVRGAVDEIVVVDTGSKDRTVAIAEAAGARVLHHRWTGDFAQARNVSLDAAGGDWILFLDADEELVHGERLREAIAEPGAEGFWMRELNYMGEDAGVQATASPAFRLFRNRPEYRFDGAVHEQVLRAVQDRDPRAVGFADAEIHHYGYIGSQAEIKAKGRRNLALLEKELRKDPNDPFTLFNAGMEHQRLRNSAAAIDYYTRAFANLPSMDFNYASLLVRNLAVELIMGERHDDALELTTEALKVWPDLTDLLYLQGQAYAGRREYRSAIRSTQAAVELGDHAGNRHLAQMGAGSFHGHAALGVLSQALGDQGTAIRELTMAVEGAPGYFAAPLARLTALLLDTTTPDDAVARLMPILPARRRGDSILAVARVLARRGHPDRALDLLAPARAAGADAPATHLVAAECHLLLGEPERALQDADAVPPASDAAPTACRMRALVHLAEGRPHAAGAELPGFRAGALMEDVLALELAVAAVGAGDAPPVPPGADRGRLVDAVMSLAEVMLDLGRLDVFNALTGLLYRVARSPGDVHERLGLLLFENDFPEPAADRLLAAADAGAAGPDAYAALAAVCESRGMPDDALALLEQALEHDQQNLSRYISLARFQASQAHYAEAAEVLRRGLVAFPHATVLRELGESLEMLATAMPAGAG